MNQLINRQSVAGADLVFCIIFPILSVCLSFFAYVYVCICMKNVLINYKSNIKLWTEHH